MKFAGTEMSMILFAIIVFELLMLFFQIIYFLERPSDRKRLWYLLLLIFLLFYNIAGGLLPDSSILIPITIQTIIAYMAGFTMSAYFVIYFYKAFDLRGLKFFATYGVLIFLVLPFVFLFVVPYVITNDLDFSRRLTVIIPFLYCVAFIWYTGKALFEKLRETERGSKDFKEVALQIIPAFIALVFWGALPIITFFGDFQVLEHSVTNAGFLFMSLTYVRSSIVRSKKEFNRLQFSEWNLQEMATHLRAMERATDRLFEMLDEQEKKKK